MIIHVNKKDKNHTYAACICTIKDSTEVATGDILDIVLTANNGYYFDPVPTLEVGTNSNQVTQFNKVNNGLYNLTYTVPETEKDLYLWCTVSKGNTFYVETSYCSCNIEDGTLYTTTEEIKVSLTADEGYYFETEPYIYHWASGQLTKIYLISEETTEYKTSYSVSFICDKGTDLYLKSTAVVIPTSDKFGIITIYNPTADELRQIGNVRYHIWRGETQIVDLGNYISSLIKVFVNLPDNLKKQNVVLGGYDTEVPSAVVLNEIVETSCGSINIRGKYGNVMDYQNSTIEIYLPFIGFQTLEASKVMNQTIKLVYRTNIINGDSLALIYNDNNSLLYSFDCNLSFEIPYKTQGAYDSRSKLSIESNYLHGFKPFVRIWYNKPYNSASISANDDRVTIVGKETGFISCSQVFNTIKATTQEKQAIDRMLENGIIVE